MESPLALFPLVVWEMILDKVGHSETVYSVLKMFPELDLALQSKKHKWLLEKILPFITTWTKLLEEKELLKLRLGCKHWIQQVDTFLENQPRLRPYHPYLQSDDQFICNSKAHFRQHLQTPLDDAPCKKTYCTEGENKLKLEFDSELEDWDSNVEEYFAKIETHPEEKNPFLARSLSVKCEGYRFRMREHRVDDESLHRFFENVIGVLEKLGKHIWFYSVEVCVECQHAGRTLQWLTRSLDLLPNLKGLDVTLHNDRAYNLGEEYLENLFGNSATTPINLSSLESIRVFCGGDLFSSRLMRRISSPTIRRLTLDFYLWREEYSQLFTTVTEFKLSGIKLSSEGNVAYLRELILSLEAPQLAKLQLELEHVYLADYGYWYHPPMFIEEDIFQWLKRFPSLKYLDIRGKFDKENLKRDFNFQEKGTLSPERDSHPSLQFLSIRDNFALSYDFLRCLPSLQHLQIFTDYNPKVVDLSNEKVVRIRGQIETGTMHKSNIWELIPSLRSVTIVSEWNTSLSNFDRAVFSCGREKYEYFKQHPDYQGFDQFRRDVAKQLMICKRKFPNWPQIHLPLQPVDDLKETEAKSIWTSLRFKGQKDFAPLPRYLNYVGYMDELDLAGGESEIASPSSGHEDNNSDSDGD